MTRINTVTAILFVSFRAVSWFRFKIYRITLPRGSEHLGLCCS